jgi:ELWxxDGT repeat protein
MSAQTPSSARAPKAQGHRSVRLDFEPLEDRTTPAALLPKDINPSTVALDPGVGNPVAIGSNVYFQASTPTNGIELWKSDGSAGGTAQLDDLIPGSVSSLPRNLTNANGTLYFTTNVSANHFALWKSDGTAANTTLLRVFTAPGTVIPPANLTPVGSNLYFTANDQTGTGLWMTDGTAAGTVFVSRISTSPSAGASIANLTNANGTLYFTANDGTNGTELWKSNGTAAGTVLAADINPGSGSSNPSGLTVFGTSLYFAATDPTHGTELWSTNLTTGVTALFMDIQSGTGSSNPAGFAVVGSNLFFAADDGMHGRELWKVPGVTAPAILVKDINTAPGPAPGSSTPVNLTNVNGTLFFSATDGVTGMELYKSDGTATGTVRVADLAPGAASSSPTDITAVGSTAYFFASVTTAFANLYKSDGTGTGTVLVKTFHWTTGSNLAPSGLTNLNGTVLFDASDSSASANTHALWKSDGTSAGTVPVAPTAFATQSSVSFGTTVVAAASGSSIYFAADDGTHGTQLWKSDGSAAGTTAVSTLGVTGSYSPDPIGALGSTVFFSATPSGVQGLYETDGTSAGTAVVAPLTGTVLDYTSAAVNGKLLFVTFTGPSTDTLWSTDGTAANTGAVIALTGSYYSGGTPSGAPVVSGGNYYFVVMDSQGATALWKSDGTAAGTGPVVDPALGVNSPLDLTDVNGILYFVASVAGNMGLYRTDGTSANTVLVANISGFFGPLSSLVANLNGTAYFLNSAAPNGPTLYKTDGTPGGTVPVAALTGTPGSLTVAGSMLYFLIAGTGGDTQLWTSDGTNVTQLRDLGTAPVAMLTPVVGSRLAFTVSDANGREWWATDGTVAGTGPAGEVVPGSGDGDIISPIVAGGHVFFFAYDQTHGREPWVLTNSAPVTDVTLSNASVTENQPAGTVVGTVGAVDADLPATVITYTLVSGTGSTDNASFQIVGNQLQTAAVLDSETQSAYSVRVRATNADGLTFEKVLTLTATDAPAGTISFVPAAYSTPDGDSGTHTVTLTVHRSGGTDGTSVHWSTMDGAATAGTDYVAASGDLTWAVGDTADKTITVTVNGDPAPEPDQSFTVVLSAPTGGATIGTNPATVTIVDDDNLRVTALTPMVSGFEVDFNYPLNPALLNLYTGAGIDGPADLTLTGPAGAVNGSLVLSPDDTRATFVATGGPLPAGSYSVVVRSAANGFVDTAGNALDGDSDGIPGGNYTGSFTVTPSPAVVVSLPNFVRGAGQTVDVPLNAPGLPLSISSAATVTGVTATVLFDPTLLSITGAVAGPNGGTVSLQSVTGGVQITVTGMSGAAGSNVPVAYLTTSVPSTAPYTSKELLSVTNVTLTTTGPALSAVGDEAVHVAAFVGDVTGDQQYTSADMTVIQQMILGIVHGLPVYPLADPLLIADTNSDGIINSADVTIIQRAILGINNPLPPLPSGTVSAGTDPRLYLSAPASILPGQTVTVALRVDVTDLAGVTINGGEYAIGFDPTRVRVSNVRTGSLLPGFRTVARVDPKTGVVVIDQSGPTTALGSGADGAVVLFDVTVRPGASGAVVLNLLADSGPAHTELSGPGGELTLNPAPTNAPTDVGDATLKIDPRAALGGHRRVGDAWEWLAPDVSEGSTDGRSRRR